MQVQNNNQLASDLKAVRTINNINNMSSTAALSSTSLIELTKLIPQWGHTCGFSNIGISNTDTSKHHNHLIRWLRRGDHGSMDWMRKHLRLRIAPRSLHAPTQTIIMCSMIYTPEEYSTTLNPPHIATVARYARGRDYHKLMRSRLKRLAVMIEQHIKPHNYRVVSDSAPLLEKMLAVKAGLGWIGKNTMLINRDAGSWSLLGAILTDLPLPIYNGPTTEHCASCRQCLDNCPTNAFRGPYQLDARKCISYLTIENRGAIPLELRSKIGNHIFGCDICQSVCPWNKKPTSSSVTDFKPRHNLDHSALCELFMWSQEQYQQRSQGMAIKRCGYSGWLRNIAVGLGNAPKDLRICETLKKRLDYPDAMVREHVQWALQQQQKS